MEKPIPSIQTHTPTMDGCPNGLTPLILKDSLTQTGEATKTIISQQLATYSWSTMALFRGRLISNPRSLYQHTKRNTWHCPMRLEKLSHDHSSFKI